MIALVPEAVAALRVHKKRQAEEKLATGPAWQERDLIFPSRIGTPMRGDNLLKRSLRPLLEKASLPPLTFHELRHTFATFQLAAGERPKVVQEILGHSSIKTTMDTYSHIIPGMQEEAAGRLQRLLFGPTPVALPSDDENVSLNNEEQRQKIPRLQGGLERARQDSNLRPSLFVVLLPMFSDVRWCPEVGLSKQLLSLPVRRCSLRFSFYCCPTAAMRWLRPYSAALPAQDFVVHFMASMAKLSRRAASIHRASEG